MRYKVVPEPLGLDALTGVQRAVPLVPDSVEDCCTRIRDGVDLASRDVAREWLTFAEALELVEETARGYRRLRRDPGQESLGAAFVENVFGVSELLTALEDGRLDVEGAFERVRESVPRWERDRHADWETEWRERTGRLLEWAVEFDLVRRTDGRYALVRASDD